MRTRRSRSIDAAEALAMPGVLAVVTAPDLAGDGLGDIPCAVPVKGPGGQPMPSPGRPLLARDRVRFVGEPVAMVVAETLAQARDAVESVLVDYAPLPAVAAIEDAVAERFAGADLGRSGAATSRFSGNAATRCGSKRNCGGRRTSCVCSSSTTG